MVTYVLVGINDLFDRQQNRGAANARLGDLARHTRAKRALRWAVLLLVAAPIMALLIWFQVFAPWLHRLQNALGFNGGIGSMIASAPAAGSTGTSPEWYLAAGGLIGRSLTIGVPAVVLVFALLVLSHRAGLQTEGNTMAMLDRGHARQAATTTDNLALANTTAVTALLPLVRVGGRHSALVVDPTAAFAGSSEPTAQYPCVSARREPVKNTAPGYYFNGGDLVAIAAAQAEATRAAAITNLSEGTRGRRPSPHGIRPEYVIVN